MGKKNAGAPAPAPSQTDSFLVNLFSFIALFIAAILFFVIKICGTGSSPILSWLEFTKDVLLLVGIGVPAYNFAKRTNQIFWIVLYWIAFVVYLACLVWSILSYTGVV